MFFFFLFFFLDSCSFWFVYDYEECRTQGIVGASAYVAEIIMPLSNAIATVYMYEIYYAGVWLYQWKWR